jgi:phosphatidylinositol glycan class B
MNLNALRPTIYYWILFIAAIVYFITAYNSHGYIDPDEHFQIIEFARLKMGMNSPDAMPWEYTYQIRPTIQPFICFLLFKFLNFIHITDLYTLGFFLRLLTALLALYSIHRFVRCTEHFITNENAKTFYYLLSYLIWFIPFLSVHFGSETWGGLFFLNALTMYFDTKISNRKYFLIGCMLGISFLFRFQMAFAAMGFILWLLFFNKMTIKNLREVIAGSFLWVLIGAIIDCWFYRKLVFTPWNYFQANIINDAASAFGTSPWYEYLKTLLFLPGYFLGVLFILSLIILIVTNPKNIVLWCILPFFIMHSIVPHKEDRFMFPMIHLLPLLLVSAYEKLRELANKRVISILNYLFIVFFVTLNLAGLIFFASRPAATGKMEMIRFIHNNYADKPVNLIHCVYSDVLDKHARIVPYEEKNLHTREIKNLCALSDSLIIPGEENILIIRKEDLLLESCSSALTQNHFIFKQYSMPEWGQWLNANIYYGFNPQDVYELYRHE